MVWMIIRLWLEAIAVLREVRGSGRLWAEAWQSITDLRRGYGEGEAVAGGEVCLLWGLG